MDLLIGSHAYLGLARDYDPETGSVSEYEPLNDFYCYGITKLPSAHFAAAQKRWVEPGEADASFVLVYDGEFRPAGRFGDKYLDLHEIQYGRDGLYFAQTGKNQLLWKPIQQPGRYHEYLFERTAEDTVHFNSIKLFEDGSLYTMLHFWGEKPTQIAEFVHKRDGFHRVQTGKIPVRGGHNICGTKQRICVNSSDEGSVKWLDLAEKEVLAERSFGNIHTKGMQLTDDYVIVGVSKKAERDERFTSESKVVALERDTLEVVSEWQPTYEDRCIGNINELQAV